MPAYAQFARYYDALTGNVDYLRRGAYFSGLIRKYAPRSELVLDAGCGTGSLSLELARQGYDVIGVDASPEMLSAAMQKASETEKSILFLNQTLEKLDLYGTVDAAVCALDTLNHIPPERLEDALQRIALFLVPGGVLLFDVNTQYKHRQVLADQTFVYDLDQVYCVWQNGYRTEDDGVEITLDFFERTEGNRYRRSTERFEEYHHPDVLLRALLERQGLALLDVFHEDSEEPPRPDSQRLVYAARKQLRKELLWEK